MAKIIISELHSTDAENFLDTLDNVECQSIYGGDEYDLTNISKFVETVFDFLVISLAIYSIVDLVKTYINHNNK